MAVSKEAVALVLDVGPSMCSSSCLLESVQIINLILQRKIFSESKDEVMLILFGTPNSNNELNNCGQYANVTVEKPLAPVTFDLVEFIQSRVTEMKGVPADFIDALVVAMDELKRNTEGKKSFTTKRIILFSNLREAFITDQLNDIMAAMKECCFEFNYIGPALDDEEGGDRGGDESPDEASRATNGEVRATGACRSTEGRDVLKRILDRTLGEYFSLGELLPCLSFMQSRSIKSTAWKAPLKIGTSLEIPISLYIKMKAMKPKSFKNVYSARPSAEIERSRSYHLMDDLQTEVDRADVIEGHRYGSTLVPFSADDKEAMKVKAEKCFKVLGFTKSENVKRFQFSGDTIWLCLAEKDNEAAQISLSALINALYETNMVAIVRRVHANGGNVKIGCLFPHIKAKYECLFYVELPFAEDLHQSTFKSLPVSNQSKKYSLSDDQLDAVDKLIDGLDLSCSKGDEDDSEELFKPKYLFNPYLQHLFQCIEHKALHPDESLPKLNPVISQSFQPPKHLVEASKQFSSKLSQVFDLKPNAESSSINASSLRATGKLSEADAEGSSTLDALADLKNKTLPEACIQMHKKVLQLANDGNFQDNPKIFDGFGFLRNESLKQNNSCGNYNGMLHDLRKSLHGSARNVFLVELSKRSLGIVTKGECSGSTSTDDEAAEFFVIPDDAIKADSPAP